LLYPVFGLEITGYISSFSFGKTKADKLASMKVSHCNQENIDEKESPEQGPYECFQIYPLIPD
jgi:hypothetical protein